MRHELTKHLWAIFITAGSTPDDVEKYLRSYLREKAQKLQDKCFENRDLLNRAAVQLTIKEAREILGLEKAERVWGGGDGKDAIKFEDEKPYREFDLNGRMNPQPKPDEPQSGRWCEEISRNKYGWYFMNPGPGISDQVPDSWNACPVCKADRPQEPKSLETELAEHLEVDFTKWAASEAARKCLAFLKTKGISL
jgi:hypothetical protein